MLLSSFFLSISRLLRLDTRDVRLLLAPFTFWLLVGVTTAPDDPGDPGETDLTEALPDSLSLLVVLPSTTLTGPDES